MTSGPLTAPQDGVGGSNGLYRYGSSSVFPNETYNSENYWVDVVFNTSGGSGRYHRAGGHDQRADQQHDDHGDHDAVRAGRHAPRTNVGVTQVSWANNRGGSGTATGTTAWSVSASSRCSPAPTCSP